MGIRSGFFNSVNGDRKYDARRFAEYFASFIGNGVFPKPSSNLQVLANDGMTVTVKAGKAWINGYILINDDNYILQIDPADGALNRIDRIVARYDVVDREIRLEVKKGEFASNPIAPVLQRDSDAYELALADIAVNAGATSVTTANITDLRNDTELCGKVDSLIAGDITSLIEELRSHKTSNVSVGNPNNPHGISKEAIGLGNVQNYGIATQAEAQAGTSNAKYMTPLRVKEAIDKLSAKTTYVLTPLQQISPNSTYTLTIPLGKVASNYIEIIFPSHNGNGSEEYTIIKIDVNSNTFLLFDKLKSYAKNLGVDVSVSTSIDINIYCKRIELNQSKNQVSITLWNIDESKNSPYKSNFRYYTITI